MANVVDEQRQEIKERKLTCLIRRSTFPDQEWYESHRLVHAKRIADMLDEEFPGYIDTMSKINEKHREIKNMGRQIEFIEEQQQREFRNKRRLEELTYCLSAGISPSGEGLKRLLSED